MLKTQNITHLIQLNQNNAVKQILEKKIEDADKKITEFSGLVTVNLLKTKISEFENKLPDNRALELPLFLI